ncbi:protein kinase domain-containing protein, partial [Actinomadura sp. HBU206391]|uniref:protein kinase domain-containing protein n=1 Tax=Actinomadura sp. HBU206391 TaxID=2731692 RepID=UPI001E07E7D4|nr:hypothetical protein [Actinomadura sp. HBU206391]
MVVDPQEFEALLVGEITQNGDAAAGRLLDADGDSRVRGTVRFLQNVLDWIADHEYQHGPDQFLAACRDARSRFSAVSDGVSPNIAGLLDLITLNSMLLDRRFKSPSIEEQRQADDECRALFADGSAIRQAIEVIYRPEPGPENASKIDAWDQLDFGSMSYYKAGTTSFILRGHSRRPIDQSGARRALAVKCVLFPWNKLTAIAKATDDYATEYGASRVPDVVVHPIASSTRWVILPFQEGQTLAERLVGFDLPARPGTDPPSVAERVVEARSVARELTRVLHRLADGSVVDPARPDRQHRDLSPSNVILEPGTGSMKLIDLGVNHLYSRQVGIAEHDDSVYTAPEIKNRGGSATADAYSLGIILTRILCGYAPRDSRVPTEVWEISPLLGRALDDLIEENHSRRLVLRHTGDDFSFAELGRSLEHTFELVDAELDITGSVPRRLFSQLAPTSREVSAQCKRWWRDRRSGSRESDIQYLLLFSVISTWCWWFIAAKTALAKVDDIATSFGVKTPKLAGVALAANLIALSQGLLAAKVYQSLLARLTTRHISGLLARATELVMRLMTVVALPTTILAVYWKPWLWAYCSAGGALIAALSNWLTLTTANRIYQSGQGVLSSVPPRGKMFSRGYEQWWWTMLLYAALIGLIALGLQTGWMRDMWA